MLEYYSEPMLRNIFRKAISTISPNLRDVDFDALTRAASLGTGTIDLVGGLQMFTEGQIIYVASPNAWFPPVYWPQLSKEYTIETGLAPMGNDWVLHVEEISGSEALSQVNENQDPFTAWLDVDLARDLVWVRNYHPGDKFEPLGMPGMQVKLSDLFVNQKIPKRARPKWPLVCVGDEIAWVVGLRVAHAWRVTEKTQKALRMQLNKLQM